MMPPWVVRDRLRMSDTLLKGTDIMTQPYDPYAAPVPPGEDRRLDAVDSVTQGWRALAGSLLSWVLAFLLILVVTVGATLTLVIPIALTETPDEDRAVALAPATVAVVIVVYAVLIVLSLLWTLNVYRNSVRQVQGESVAVADFFRVRGLGLPLVAYLLMSLTVAVGMVLLVIPGLLAAFFLMYVPYLACSRPEAGLAAAFRGSVAVARANPGASLLLLLFSLLLNVVGGLTVVGVLITTPLAACMMAYAALRGSGDRFVHRP